MKKNGFTLIELLAVIVILAIIALIATPIILGIINDAREKANERSVELYASAVRNGIAAHQLREGKEVLPGTYNETNKLPFEVESDGDVDCTNVIISEEGKVSLEGCTVNGGEKKYSYGTKQGSEPACTLDDKDGDGKASLSDVVTCGTESFYVMSNENSEITMLSMYSLYVGKKSVHEYDEYGEGYLIITPLENPTNKQSILTHSSWDDENSGRVGTNSFASEAYWAQMVNGNPIWVYNENSNLYPYVSEYERILKEELKVSSAKATLISYEQLEDLGCSGADYSCDDAPEWVYSTTYWTGTASDSLTIWFVAYGGEFVGPTGVVWFEHEDNWNVRPVITISTSEIQ